MRRKGHFRLGMLVVIAFGVTALLIIKNNLIRQEPLSPVPSQIVDVAAGSPVPATPKPTPKTSEKPFKVSPESFAHEVDSLFTGKQGLYGWYIQSLTTGRGYGSNADFSFTAASINKIPIMLSFLQSVEEGTYSLDDEYVLEQQDIEEGSGTLQYQQLGSSWQYSKLVEFAGHYSDNTAINALHRLAGLGSAQKLVSRYGLEKTSIAKNTSSPKDMVTLLSQVYLKKLIRDDELLDLLYTALQKTAYEEDLIPEGVPPTVLVSHKIGWQIQVWSDCGIVFSDNPYALCIMTDGIAESEAREILPQISRKVWVYESGEQN